jgi:hypothetical protein
MEKDFFLKWLVGERKLAMKAAQDAVSRCKRVESVLDQTLEKATASQSAFDSALTRIWKAHPHRNDLLYAMRLYVSFKNPTVDTKRYAFYGELKRMRQPGEPRPRVKTSARKPNKSIRRLATESD